MSNYFYGEYGANYRKSVALKDLSPVQRILGCLIFILPVLSIVMIFIPATRWIGIGAVIASAFIYIPIACISVFAIPKKSRLVPYILVSVGIVGLAIYLFLVWYFINYEFNVTVILGTAMAILFLVFLLVGIGILRTGIIRNRKWQEYSIVTQATVTGYRNIHTNMFAFDNIQPGLNNATDQSTLYSPLFEYSVNGIPYKGETTSYFSLQQLPPVGGTMEIHVNRANVKEFALKIQKGSMYITTGIMFIVVSLVVLLVGVLIMIIL